MFEQESGFRSKRTAIIVGGVLLLLVVVIGFRMTRSHGPATAALEQQAIPLVSVLRPNLVPVTATVTFTGTISARYDIPITSEGDPGRIVAIYVEAGDHVKRGQRLAQVDQSVLKPQINNMAAALEAARAQAALSMAEYKRAEAVKVSGALSAEEVERRHAASVTDQARVDVAAAQLAEMQARLDRSDIRAPENGVVLTRTAELGQTVSAASAPLFRLARDGEVEMRGQVAEQDVTSLKIGQPAAVYLTGSTEPFEGHVRLLGAVIDPATRLGEIRVALKSSPALRPGSFARGEVTIGNAKRPVLPQTAVFSDTKGSFVYVVSKDSIVERRPVTVTTTTADGIVIGAGLAGDERVITLAGAFLREGEKVEVAPDIPSAPAVAAQP